MGWIDWMNRTAERLNETRYGYTFFKYNRPSGLYMPVTDERQGPYDNFCYALVYARAEKIAHLLTEAILDEDLPVEMDITESGCLNAMGNGRKGFADILGRMEHYPAIPNLNEAMMHDLNDEMRRQSVKSLGFMGKKANCSAPNVCKRLSEDSNVQVRISAAETLRRIGDSRTSVPLRDAYEYARFRLLAYATEKIYSRESAPFIYLLEESLLSLFGFDMDSAREALMEGMSDENPNVRHCAKRATIRAGQREMIDIGIIRI